MSHHVIEYDQECKPCNGTGLYMGLAERDGAAVVCHTCNGSAYHHVKIEYDDFEGRQKREAVHRIFQTNPGICIGGKLEDFGGMTYQEWLAGLQFSKGMENRKYTCPAWWYQSAEYELKPKWDECLGAGCFSGCKHFSAKNKCWERFDKENEA